jgi:HlyD family secretion protein
MSSLVFDMSIDELDVGSVKAGQEVTITADALEGKTFTGYVDKVNIKGTTSNGVTTYPVTVYIKDADGLLPGMNVNASIIVQSSENVLAIPVSAISRGNTVLLKKEDAEDLTQSASGPDANNSRQAGQNASGETSGRDPANGGFAGRNRPGSGSTDENSADGSSAGGDTTGRNRSGGSLTAGNSADGSSPGGNTARTERETLPDGFVRVRVELGINDENYIEVKSGLAEGDTIAIPVVKTVNSQTTSRTASPGMSVGGPGMMGPGMTGGGTRVYTAPRSSSSGGNSGGSARPSFGG